jgi:hypothetical protein
MRIHGNELHSPSFSEITHKHIESDITDLSHDAIKIKGKEIDDSAIGDGKVLGYRAASGKIEYIPAPSGSSNCQICDVDDLPTNSHPGHAVLLTADWSVYICTEGTGEIPCGGCTFENVDILPLSVELGEGVFLSSDKHIYIGV